jgi:O-antigen ligase
VSTGKRFLAALYGAFVIPSTRQLEAYGRFVHNLAAACVIAAMSIIFTESRYGLVQVFALFAAGVSCFVLGALFSRGD